MIQTFSTRSIRSQYEDFMRVVYKGRDELSSFTRSKTTISSGFPEQGGGSASADVDAENSIGGNEAPTVSANDDDGDSDDGDPDRRSKNGLQNQNCKVDAETLSSANNQTRDHAVKQHPSSHRAQAQLNATASAGASPSPQNPDIALWRLPTVLAHVPVSRSHWWAGVAEGRYPAPVKLSKRCVAWRSADIRALIASF